MRNSRLRIGVGRRRWKGQHRDVPIVVADGLRLRQRAVELARTLDRGFRPDDFLHGVFGLDPRSAAAVPAGVVVHIDFDPQPAGFGDHVLEQLAPLRTGERHRAQRNALVDLHNQHAADADAVHRFKIGGDAFAGDVAVQPEPIDPRLGRFGRGKELRGQAAGRILPRRDGRRDGAEPQGGNRQKCVEILHGTIPPMFLRRDGRAMPRSGLFGTPHRETA